MPNRDANIPYIQTRAAHIAILGHAEVNKKYPMPLSHGSATITTFRQTKVIHMSAIGVIMSSNYHLRSHINQNYPLLCM
jgi:hypothetical protein